MKWNEKINLKEHKVFFTSDLHLFHDNILRMNNRPYKNVYDMYDDIKEKWNSKVTDRDYVFVLGDVLWGSQATKLKSLSNAFKGKICIVLGNHDKVRLNDSKHPTGTTFDVFHSVERADYITFYDKERDICQDIYMCHYPAMSWVGKSRGSWHLHGHVHGKLDEINKTSPDLREDVGIDSAIAHYDLVSFDDLYEHFMLKTNGVPFHAYMQKVYERESTIK